MDVYEFTATADGPTLVVLGGVHGNESAGVVACHRLLAGLESGAQLVESGRLLCVPVVNVPAFARNRRYIDRNLNRIMGDDDDSDSEGAIAALLRPVLDEADFLLDLHSYTVGGPPFVFGEDDEATRSFASAMPAAAYVTGWSACFAAAFPHEPASGIGTCEYARAQGAVAITLECGGHNDPAGPDHGFAAIERALAYTGLVRDGRPRLVPPPRHVRMKQVFIKTGEGRFARPWGHLDPIADGQVFARLDDGDVLRAQGDGFVVLPNEATAIGTEWGYMASAAG